MFGEFLKRLRLAKGISLRQFAKETEISAAYLCDVEKNRRGAPGYEVLCRMKKVLELSGFPEKKFDALAINENSNLPPDIIAKLKDYPELLTIISEYKA